MSPRREVPGAIDRPPYADNGIPEQPTADFVSPPEVIARMREACRLAARLLVEASALAKPGVTTEEIDAFIHDRTIAAGAYPSTLNYRGYPKSCCTSVNEVICHGIPDDRVLRDGDIVNVDVSVFIDGVHGDTDATYPVGTVHPDDLMLIDATRDCLDAGIAAVSPGRPMSDIGRAIQARADAGGYSVVRSFTGHGIGRSFHNGLTVYHHYEPAARIEMKPGMTFTIEPMIAKGTWRHNLWSDGWTAVTADLERTAQFEHTVLVTDEGAEILTVV